MISKLLIHKDYQIRKKFLERKYNFYFFNSILFNSYFNKKVLFEYWVSLYFSCFLSKIKNFCVLSYRRRGVFNFFKLTRMLFKYYALNKYLTGVLKFSW